MEYGIRLSEPHPLPSDPRQACSGAIRDLLPPGVLRAAYFGSEFCEDLLPDLPEAERFCSWAQEAGVEAVLMTPIVRPGGLGRVKRLLEGVAGRGRPITVVFNDWGIFRMLRSDFPRIGCRAGRLINRALRDPRLAGQTPEPRGEHASRGSQIRELLLSAGVAAIETDPDLEGSYLGEEGTGLQRVLHLPYSFAATGRNCLFKAETQQGGNNFARWLGSACSAPCRGRFHPVPRSDIVHPLWRAGNTLFHEVPPALVRGQLSRADRVVIHERPLP